MLTSTHPSTGSNGVIKSLHENPSESKTPENELIYVKEVQSVNEASESKQEEESHTFEQKLSTRAMRMKEAISKHETVKVQTM